MGIKDLSKVIGDHAEKSVRQTEINSFFGRKVAIDASMSLYQFLIAVRQDGAHLMNDKGETTSHLNGMFYRTIRMMENGLKPVFVFDGKPPDLKSDELHKRTERRVEAQKELDVAMENGDTEAIEKFTRRLVKVTKEHNDQAKQLLRAMGVPVVEAPCEAESQCAELVRKGKVFASGTEDMDALTFGSKILLRHLTFSEAKKVPIKEYTLEKILNGLDMSMEQFVDLCILLGCDYCETIKGVGPKKAFDLISKHKNIESILKNIDHEKYPPPKNWNYKGARRLFLHPDVIDGDTIELQWNEPDEAAVIKLMVEENGFAIERIQTALTRLNKSRRKAQQGRIDCFFQALPVIATEGGNRKRKAAEEEKSKAVNSKIKKLGKTLCSGLKKPK